MAGKKPIKKSKNLVFFPALDQSRLGRLVARGEVRQCDGCVRTPHPPPGQNVVRVVDYYNRITTTAIIATYS